MLTKFICAMLLTVLFGAQSIAAEDHIAPNILIYPESGQTDLSNMVTTIDATNQVKVKAVNPTADEKKTITILSADGSDPSWISFALTNPSNQTLTRLITFPYSGGGADHVWMPNLSAKRITQLYSGSSASIKRKVMNNADSFIVELPAKKTVTFIGRIADAAPNRISVWDLEAYASNQSYVPFYQGILIGLIILFAGLTTALLVIKQNYLYIFSCLLGWGAFIFALHEFNYLNFVVPFNGYIYSLIRALSEAIIAIVPLMVLLSHFRVKPPFNIENILYYLPQILITILAVLALASPSFSATIARLAAPIIGMIGLLIILRFNGSDKSSVAQAMMPPWILFMVWTLVQIYTSLSSQFLHLNLISTSVYAIFLLMSFVAMLKYYSDDLTEEVTVEQKDTGTEQVALQRFNEAIEPEKPALNDLALSGSGQILWEWDLERSYIKCAHELDDLLLYAHGSLSCDTREWIHNIHSRDVAKFESLINLIMREGNSRIDHDFRLRASTGEYFWFELRATAVTDDEGYLVSFIGALKNVTAERKSMERLYHDAVHDYLTGLPNRSLFMDRLERAISRASSTNTKYPALILIDINRFKAVNESVGFAVADSLLITLARRLEEAVGDTETVARLAADQFAVIINEYGDMDSLKIAAQKLQKAIALPIQVNHQELSLNCCLGISLIENNFEQPDELLQKAELALGHAKQIDHEDIIFYSRDLNQKGDKFSRENDLRQAIARNEFEMFYQPIVSLETMRPIGFEALIRWHHPTEGDIPPADFIQLAEETGHIHELGKFALTQAAKQLNLWQRTFNQQSEPLFVSVNMSSLQLFKPELVEQVSEVLSRFNVIEGTLKLEVTESLVMKNPEQARIILNRLKDIGAGLACDDFGTGYSSLAYLHQFPFDIVKIDRSFISGENFGSTRPIILKAILQLSKDLGLRAVAEGVETDAQAHELIDMGCELVQGFRFGEPNNAKSSLSFLTANAG